MRAIVCAVLFFLATAPGAHSQEPTPSAPESRQHEQAQPERSQEPSDTQKQATPQPPIIVNVLPPHKTESELADERHEREEKSGLERRLVDYTWGLFIATIVLAVATVFLVIGTGAIAVLGWKQSRDTKASIDISRQTLIASQRAWIKRDRIAFSTPLEVRDDGLVNSAIAFEFTNVGNAPALHINEFAWLLPVTDGLVPQERATELFAGVRKHPVSGGFTLFPGQSYPRDRDIPVHHSVHLTNEQADAASDDAGRISLFVAACINYVFSSDLNHHHQTSCLFEVRTPGFITHVKGTAIAETNLRLDESGFLGMDVAD